ncbi:MAG: S1C family serine protease [Candidatus Limnocylindria bacterium]
MGPLTEIGQAVADVAGRIGPSTVGIGNRWRGGSGVVVAKGRILTSAHNLHGDEARIYFADGREATGRVLGIDLDGDLAVLEAETGSTVPLEWGDGTALMAGTPVIALGNPAGNGARATVGFVSSVGRSFRGPHGRPVGGAVEHTAPLKSGSSGGPIVDADGKLLGINTLRLGGGFYLAIAADGALRSRVDALGRGEAPQRRRLGIGIAPGHVARQLRRAVGLPPRDGLLVRDVEEDSPAAKAGIVEGDLIVAAGGADIKDADDLFGALAAAAPDAALSLTVVRGTEERTVEVAPGA